MKFRHTKLASSILKYGDKVLPDTSYFIVFRFLYLLTNRSRRPSETSFHVEKKGLYRAHDNRYGDLWFCERTRFRFYHWPDGIQHRLNMIRSKYQNNKVKVVEGDIVVDIGSNIGEFSLSVAGLADSIVAFEPDPLAYRCLDRNSQSLDMLHPVNLALSNHRGEVSFFLNTKEADSSIVEPEEYTECIKVLSKTLDDALYSFAFKEINFLKVEAEGWEPEILNGAIETLQRTKKIAVDAGPERYGKVTAPDVCALLEKAGFQVERENNMVFAYR